MSVRAPAAGPVLIVGCQRSGTTLVRQMCSRHPHVDVMPETHLMPLLWGESGILRKLGRLGIATWLRQTMPRVNPAWHRAGSHAQLENACDRYRDDALQRGDAALADAPSIFGEWLDHWSVVTGMPRPGEKTPSHIYYLAELMDALPSAQAIVMHRDPRAAGCSEWLKHRDINQLGRHFTWFRFAVRWASSVEVARRCKDRFGPERVLQLRYEDVVASPGDAARRICSFLGEPFDPSMVEVETRNTSFGDSPEHASVAAGIDSGSRDRWRGTLEPRTVSRLESLTARGMEALGYEREADRSVRALPTAGWGVHAMATLAGYRPAGFNQLASRNRYPGLHPGDPGRRSA